MTNICRVSIHNNGGSSFIYFDKLPNTGELVDFILNRTNRHVANDTQLRRLAMRLIESGLEASFSLGAELDGPVLKVQFFSVVSCKGLTKWTDILQPNISS